MKKAKIYDCSPQRERERSFKLKTVSQPPRLSFPTPPADRITVWHHCHPGGGGHQRHVCENLLGRAEQVSLWRARRGQQEVPGCLRRQLRPTPPFVLLVAPGLTPTTTTLWRSALVWVGTPTRSSSCSCTGEHLLAPWMFFLHVEQLLLHRWQSNEGQPQVVFLSLCIFGLLLRFYYRIILKKHLKSGWSISHNQIKFKLMSQPNKNKRNKEKKNLPNPPKTICSVWHSSMEQNKVPCSNSLCQDIFSAIEHSTTAGFSEFSDVLYFCKRHSSKPAVGLRMCGWNVSLHTFFSDCWSYIEPLTGLVKQEKWLRCWAGWGSLAQQQNDVPDINLGTRAVNIWIGWRDVVMLLQKHSEAKRFLDPGLLVCLCVETTWWTWWAPTNLMTRRLREETFLHGILTSCASGAWTQVEHSFNSIPMQIRNHAIVQWITMFTCVTTAVLKDLVMIPVHTKPDDSEVELDELYDVFMNVKKKWKTDVRTRKIPCDCSLAALQHLRDK